MSGREVLAPFVALLVGVAALTACERSPAPERAPSTSVSSSATAQESSGEITTETAPAPAASTETTAGETSGGSGDDRPSGDGVDGSGGSTGDEGGGGNGGTGGTGGNGGAVGSPIDVPTIPDPHTSMDGLRSAIEGAFVEACGDNTLCVHLEYTDGACLLGYSPSGTAPRRSTVTVLTESQEACDAANGENPEPTDGSTGEPTDVSTGTATDGATSGPATDGSTGGASGGVTSSPAAGAGAVP